MEFIKSRLDAVKIDFVSKRRYAGVVSVILVILSWVLFFYPGPNWGIDFTGGTEIHLKFTDDVKITEMRAALRELGLGEDAVQQVGSDDDHEYAIRIQDSTFGSEELKTDVTSRLETTFGADWIDGQPLFDAEVGARLAIYYTGDPVPVSSVSAALADLEGIVVEAGRDANQVVIKAPGLSRQIEGRIHQVMPDREFEVLSIDAVGPRVGGELRNQGIISVLATLGLVLIYVAFRFDIGFAPGAVVALFHDVSLTVGFFVLLQREFNLPMIGALLTIVGYSLNDTIVIYDRIRENMDRYRRQDMPELINFSVNETLSRTLATSVTTFLAMFAFTFVKMPVIQNFALAILFGIVVGTYSTVFVASPMILVMQDVKPYLAKLMAGSGPVGGDDDDEDGGGTPDLTESEKRRRERADRDREARA